MLIPKSSSFGFQPLRSLCYLGVKSVWFGRFINRDPIGEKGGLNLYGFCGNDGVNRIDYLGYSWLSKAFKSIGHFVAKYWKPIVAAVAAIATAGALAPWAAGFATGALGLTGVAANIAAGAIVGGISGFVGGATGAALNGGSLGQVLKAGLVGGSIGAVVGGIANGIWGPTGTTLKPNPGVQLAANTNDLGELVRLGAFKVVGSSFGTLSAAASSAIGAAGAASAVYGWNAATGRYDINAPSLRLPDFVVGPNTIDRSLWRVGWQAAVQGALAFADGMNPLGNPFANAGYYDPNNSALKWSRGIGVATFGIESTLLGGAGAFWAPGESVFYSGQGARLAALEYAEATGGSTIFDTVGGGLMKSFGVENKWLWSRASWFYANTAGRSAAVFIGRFGGEVGTVFADTELPVLIGRGVELTYPAFGGL